VAHAQARLWAIASLMTKAARNKQTRINTLQDKHAAIII
jgi:hypothetical protein